MIRPTCYTVCVDYADELRLSLPRTAAACSRVVVVTIPEDEATRAVVAGVPNAVCHLTRAFYERGARFNKWLALEESLDAHGREGWIAFVDADTVWPHGVDLSGLREGCLYTPLRRMCDDIPAEAPPESEWGRYPLHRQQVEWAGYTQLVFGGDPLLGQPPWHQTDWAHAGGADSFLQAKWPRERKLRPPFEVLHVGRSGANWCGRTTARADGSVPEGAVERYGELRRLIGLRRPGPDPFRHERLP